MILVILCGFMHFESNLSIERNIKIMVNYDLIIPFVLTQSCFLEHGFICYQILIPELSCY